MRQDIIAVDEGMGYALSRYYSKEDRKNFESYVDKTDPNKITESKDFCYKLISLIGPESAKHIVIDVMNEAHDKKEDAVELLKRRADNYFGKERRINQYITERTQEGMLGIFSKMTENPVKYGVKKERKNQ